LNSLAEGWSHTIRKLFEFMEAVVLFDPAREAECAKVPPLLLFCFLRHCGEFLSFPCTQVLEESKLGDITPEECTAATIFASASFFLTRTSFHLVPSPRAGLSKKPLSEEMRDLFKPLTRKNEQGGNKGSPSYANSSAASPSTSSSGPSSSSAASSNKPSAGAWLSNAFKGQTFFNKPKEVRRVANFSEGDPVTMATACRRSLDQWRGESRPRTAVSGRFLIDGHGLPPTAVTQSTRTRLR